MGQVLRAVLVLGFLGLLFVWSAQRQADAELEALAASVEQAVALGVLPAESVGHEQFDARTETWFARLAVPLDRLPAENVPSGLGGRIHWGGVVVAHIPAAHVDRLLVGEVSALLAGAPAGTWAMPRHGRDTAWNDADTVARQCWPWPKWCVAGLSA